MVSEGVAMEACGLGAAKAADQSSKSSSLHSPK